MFKNASISVKKLFFIAPILLGAVFLSGCGFRPTAPQGYEMSLEIWGVFDDTDAYKDAISDYRKLNPYIKDIRYRKLSPDTYKDDLVDALAAGKGPDIFMIRNSWRAPFEDKTIPAPEALIGEREYRGALVDVAADDFISKGKIYGIPLSVDSLALYYNKDLFNAAGISQPPETWDELIEDARRLTAVDQFGSIFRSGVALGTGANINRSSDILALLMLQLGASISGSDEGQVRFSDQQAEKALDFYLQFSRIGASTYSWNARQHYSIDAFYEGTAAMMLNYSWQLETIRQKNAKLNIGVASLPQFDKSAPKNVANYWGFVVAKEGSPLSLQSKLSDGAAIDKEQQDKIRVFEAWQFLKFLALQGEKKSMTLTNALVGTTKEVTIATDPTKAYLDKTHKPAARRDLVAAQKDDLTLAPFSYGNLIAENWYQGNAEAMDGILIDMIDSVVRGEEISRNALSTAANRINLLNR